jgi:hypothetical protein
MPCFLRLLRGRRSGDDIAKVSTIGDLDERGFWGILRGHFFGLGHKMTLFDHDALINEPWGRLDESRGHFIARKELNPEVLVLDVSPRDVDLRH